MAKIPFALIQFDKETQPRVQLDMFVVEDYATAMGQGDVFPPVLLFEEDGRYWIGDGFHRCQAARKLGLAEITAEVEPGGKRAAILASCAANAVHGLRRTNMDKQRAVKRILADDEWVQWSDGEVAKHCGVSDRMVSKYRPISESSEDSRLVRRGDSTYLMNTANIGEGLSEEVLEAAALTDIRQDHRAVERLSAMPTEMQLPVLDMVAKGTRIGSAIKTVITEYREANTELPPLPEGKYSCIVMDPPWPVATIEREVRPLQAATLDYPTMTIETIELLPIEELAADACHLYLWVTHKFLPEGLRLIAAWGFRYQCLLTWVKPTGMTPYSWMYNTEHVIFARRGGLGLQALGKKLSIEAPTTGHSRKPDAFFERVVEVSPSPRLEMFARTEHKGFESWGDAEANNKEERINDENI